MSFDIKPETDSEQRAASRMPVSSLSRFVQRPEVPALTFLLVLLCVLAFTTPGFATAANLRGVVEQAVVVAIVALAVNLLIIAGEIDISTGSTVAVCAFVYGNTAMLTGGTWIALVAAMGAGTASGLFNGILSTYGRVPSIITTLGTLFILRGIVLVVAGAQVLNLAPESRLLGTGQFIGLPISVITLVFLVGCSAILERHSTFGRDLFAIGGNARAAREVGLPIKRRRLTAFILVGICCGIASAVYLGQIGQLQATAATGLELRVIAAIVLGGTSILGGRGTTSSPIIGAMLVGVILNAMTLNRVPGTYELVVLGSLILLAVSFDGLRTRIVTKRAGS